MAGLAVGSTVILGSVAAAPLIAAIAVAVITGEVLKRVDSHFGATQALIKAYRSIGVKLDEIEWEINRHINYFENNPHMIPCLFGPCSGIRGY